MKNKYLAGHYGLHCEWSMLCTPVANEDNGTPASNSFSLLSQNGLAKQKSCIGELMRLVNLLAVMRYRFLVKITLRKTLRSSLSDGNTMKN